MNRRIYSTIFAASAVLGLIFLTGCGGGGSSTPPPKTVAIVATSGGSQSAQVGAAFAAPLVATVTTGGTPTSGASVTFTAPGSGASGTFGNGTATETDTTNASGVATSSAFTANTTAGGPYNITASTSGATTSASFSLSNTAGAPATITATSGTPQSAGISTAFGAALTATVVDASSNPVSGVTVTFTVIAGGTGASGAFATTGATDVETTDANGVATTSQALTANAIAGAFTVSADFSVNTGAPAVFSLTNTTVVVSTSNFTFYLAGEEQINGGPNYYAVAGVVQIDSTGNVLGGEQDYNDAFGVNSPEPSGDTITGGTLTVDSTTGQGTLTLITNNPALGVSGSGTGTETFGVQFVNSNHALIMQFDGTATSSGSMDLQTLPSSMDGNYAFALSGVDSGYNPFAVGGVFTISGTTIANGIDDVNDAGNVVPGHTFTGDISAPDSFGRGTITNLTFLSPGSQLDYYIVGPEVIRLIDVDNQTFNGNVDAAVGSAFGQGSSTFTNASLGSSVLTLASEPYGGHSYAAVGQFSTSNTSSSPADFAGVGESDELYAGSISGLATAFSGTYSISNTLNSVTYNGYGNLTITGGLGGGDVSVLGVYMIDPNINLNDPNNPSGGGGALVVDLDAFNAGGTGALIPQTDTLTSSFANNYAVGWQDRNYFNTVTVCNDCELDMLAQGSMVSGGALTLTGLVSDPFGTLGTPDTTSAADAFSGTPLADATNHGRYTMLSTNVPPNSLSATIDGQLPIGFDLVIYQASGGQLFWMNYDPSFTTVFSGPIEQQTSLTGIPEARSSKKLKTKKH